MRLAQGINEVIVRPHNLGVGLYILLVNMESMAQRAGKYEQSSQERG